MYNLELTPQEQDVLLLYLKDHLADEPIYFKEKWMSERLFSAFVKLQISQDERHEI